MVDAHCGGMIGAKIKLAGWDAVVLEGASDHPVYLNIVDDKVAVSYTHLDVYKRQSSDSPTVWS